MKGAARLDGSLQVDVVGCNGDPGGYRPRAPDVRRAPAGHRCQLHHLARGHGPTRPPLSHGRSPTFWITGEYEKPSLRRSGSISATAPLGGSESVSTPRRAIRLYWRSWGLRELARSRRQVHYRRRPPRFGLVPTSRRVRFRPTKLLLAEADAMPRGAQPPWATRVRAVPGARSCTRHLGAGGPGRAGRHPGTTAAYRQRHQPAYSPSGCVHPSTGSRAVSSASAIVVDQDAAARQAGHESEQPRTTTRSTAPVARILSSAQRFDSRRSSRCGRPARKAPRAFSNKAVSSAFQSTDCMTHLRTQTAATSFSQQLRSDFRP